MAARPAQLAADATEVPEVVVSRLPQYVRALTRLTQQGITVVSSQQLGDLIQMTPAQIRKDLSYFGRFGKQGRGYSVKYLLGELRRILGLDQEWRVGLVGVGRLGRAILSYPGFAPEGFKVVAAFDADPRQVGQMVAGIMVQPMHRLGEVVHELGVRIAIVAVPASQAQEVVNRLVACDVRAIVNYAPVSPQAPAHVRVRNIDPVMALQSMTYYLTAPNSAAKQSASR
ncbi:MAG: redox-sensing transcriptional repressor Rex [Chloroflexi bacterium]|nr:redox-sensing transcriptional repressor Rex [Chloroflexota bacterium]